MDYTRMYNDAAGESHFEDLSVELELTDFAPPATPFHVGPPVDADRMILCSIQPGWSGDWHPSPRRQFWIQLSGEIEVKVSDGTVRRFSAGSVVLVEDTEGRGHRTRNVGGTEVRAVFVQLP